MSKYFEKGLSSDGLRTKYRTLAKRYHPDRTNNIVDRKVNEEIFKDITAEYDIYSRLKLGDDRKISNDVDVEDIRKRWQDVWKHFTEDDGSLRDILKKTFKDTVEQMVQHFKDKDEEIDAIDGTTDVEITDEMGNSDEKVYMEINVPLSDIYNNVVKKVRVNKSLYEVNCGQRIHHMDNYVIEVLGMPHDLYRQDSIIGTNDLFCTYKIGLIDYFRGYTIRLTHLDGRIVQQYIAPLTNVNDPIVIKNEGMHHLDNLYVKVEIMLPKTGDQIIEFTNLLTNTRPNCVKLEVDK